MKSSVFFLFVIITAISYSVRLGDAVAEPPEYTLLQSEPDFEVRLYKESWWMTALVQGTSFEKSTKDGFHSGTNYTIYLQVVSIYPWRQPQLYWTSNDSSSVKQSSHWFEYLVRYYVPAKYGNVPPQPSPELNLQVETWKKQCVAVRKFTGFAKDDNVDQQVKALALSIGRHAHFSEKEKGVQNGSTTTLYSIAQYTSPHRLTGRLNEVWINVAAGFTEQGCPGALGNK